MNKLMTKQDLRKIIAEEIQLQAQKKKVIKENEAKKIPRYAVERVTDVAIDTLKTQLIRYVNQSLGSRKENTQKLKEASIVLKDLAEAMNELISEKLNAYVRHS